MTTLQKLTFRLLFFLSACGQLTKDSQHTGSEIQKVTVAFSGYGCEGECPFQVIAIDSTLKVNYYGGQFAPRLGYFEGNIPKDLWDSIQTRFEKFIKVGIDSTARNRTDHPIVEFQVKTKSRTFSFKENTGKMSDFDKDILYWYINLNKQFSYIQKKDSLHFETTIQYPRMAEMEAQKMLEQNTETDRKKKKK